MPDRTDAPPAAATRLARARRAIRSGWPWAVAACAGLAAIVLALRAAGDGSGRTAGVSLEDARRAERERNLSRMICSLADVSSAEVLLREGSGGAAPGASVTVAMRRGEALSDETASSVAALVASAVNGLDPSNVVVVDARDPARPKGTRRGEELAGEGAALFRLRQEVERALADRLRGLFAAMQIECAVAVSAELDMDRVHERVLELDPQGRGEIVLREERASGLRPADAPETASLAPGAAANRPAEIPAGRAERAGGTETRKTESAVSYVTREIARSPRGIADLRASVVLFDRLVETPDGRLRYDRTVVPEKVRLGEYARLAARALGLDDPAAVEVQYLPSPRAEPVGFGEPGPSPAALAALAAVAVAVVAFGVGLGLVRRRARRAPAPAAAPEVAPAPGPPADIRTDVRRLVAEDLERAAAILGRWIAREG